MGHGADEVASSSRSDRDRKRGGPPLGLVGLAALVALVAAYLGDCIPGLGAGGSVGTPSSEAPTPSEPVVGGEADGEARARRVIVVSGEQCRSDGGLVPCDEVCAGLDREQASRTSIEIDARGGTHGTVEALRACVKEAGFTEVHVRSE